MTYTIFKFLHVLGVVLLVGNVTVTAAWKVYADRSMNGAIVANAQRAVIYADWCFTVPGILLIMLGGYGMAYDARLDIFGSRWLLWGQGLFIVSGMIWLLVLVPAQVRQARLARSLAPGDPVPESYWRIGRVWLTWGIIATVPLVAALFVMIVK
jgi:uncharacterized membrane protein